MEAMKAKDTVRLTTLRNIKKYLIEAKTATGGIDELADAEVVKIISKLAKQGSDSAALYTRQGRGDLAAEELAQVAVMQEFLPRQLTGGREGHHRRDRRAVREGDGQGDGRSVEAPGRPGRRQGHFGQSARAARLIRCGCPKNSAAT